LAFVPSGFFYAQVKLGVADLIDNLRGDRQILLKRCAPSSLRVRFAINAGVMEVYHEKASYSSPFTQ
jgi:hypothetical protein